MKIKEFFTLIVILSIGSSYAQPIAYPFLNTKLTFEERVNDLVCRMTLEEKISQMSSKSPAIERLKIPAYNWWSGCTHGVGRTKDTVTVYPQSIALAATFNTEQMLITASQISDEARALHQKAKKEGRFGEQYYGLTMWDPNINIFRDPRWGRGHETYGEDPYLTAQIGLAFVKGLQGDNPNYLKTSACAKHFAVHSGPEYNRHSFNSKASDYDLWDTYLPAFRELITEGKVASVMCAYNRLDGEPCCGNDLLMQNILRNKFGFKGYVTSDCGAIADFWLTHKTNTGKEDASVNAVLSGTDLECGDENAYTTLVGSVKKGMIREMDIDVSLKRLFMTRFRLGMFDPDSIVPYTLIPQNCINSDAHKKQALKMARESIVLLKNEKNILPFKKDIKKIAVIGPNANNTMTPLANYNGIPEKVITILQGIREKLPNAKIIYDEACYPVVNLTDMNDVNIKAIVEKAREADVIVFVGGLNAELEGENGDAGKVTYDGFRAGDRTTIKLPEIQTNILKALHAIGKPVVFVMMTGSALAIPWEAENLPAIINAWYGGQAAGEALADVLFGDYNPSGKLPVTFYKGDNDLPDFENYSMENRTYRYFSGEVQYPFGYGLSYTSFKFDNLKLLSQIKTDGSVKISVNISNTGNRDGSEVIQLYTSHKNTLYKTPIRSLAGFQKIQLKTGETKTVEFILTPKELSIVKNDGKHYTVPGVIEISVGSGHSEKDKSSNNVTGTLELIGSEYFVY
jgi:beta-glucosidase